jgi:hypothetical protein
VTCRVDTGFCEQLFLWCSLKELVIAEDFVGEEFRPMLVGVVGKLKIGLGRVGAATCVVGCYL